LENACSQRVPLDDSTAATDTNPKVETSSDRSNWGPLFHLCSNLCSSYNSTDSHEVNFPTQTSEKDQKEETLENNFSNKPLENMTDSRSISTKSTGDLERTSSNWDSPSKESEIVQTLQKASQLAMYYTKATTPPLKNKELKQAIYLVYKCHWLISDLIDEEKVRDENVRTKLNQFIVNKTDKIDIENQENLVSANTAFKTERVRIDQQKADKIDQIITNILKNYKTVNDTLKDSVSESMRQWFYEKYKEACGSLECKYPDTRHKTSATGIYLLLKAAIRLGKDLEAPDDGAYKNLIEEYLELNSLRLGLWNDAGDAKRDKEDATDTYVLQYGICATYDKLQKVEKAIEELENKLRQKKFENYMTLSMELIFLAKYEHNGFKKTVEQNKRYKSGAEVRDEVFQQYEKTMEYSKERQWFFEQQPKGSNHLQSVPYAPDQPPLNLLFWKLNDIK
jgi:hypothetical protein